MPTQSEFRDGKEDDAKLVGMLRSPTSESGITPPLPVSGPPFQPQVELRNTIAEASQSLALLDFERLEELAIAFYKLNSDVRLMRPAERDDLARQVQQASMEMEVFARVIEATRANLNVMRRLRDLRQGCCEYDCPRLSLPETIHGDD